MDILITILEDEIPGEFDKENGITRPRTLWQGWVPVNGQVGIALPAHELRRPNALHTTCLTIQAGHNRFRSSSLDTNRRKEMLMQALMLWLMGSVKTGLPTSAKRMWDDQIAIVIGEDKFTITIALDTN